MSEEKKPLILIVDRQLSTLTSLDTLLSREGYCVTTCSSSAEALKAVVGQRLDIVIAGRGGPERHGAVLVSKIKTLSPETRVLLLIESNDDSDDSIVADAIAAGADGLLRRSYSESQVIQRVEGLIHGVPA
jgi:two-component system sensor histidine kinase/response regulator